MSLLGVHESRGKKMTTLEQLKSELQAEQEVIDSANKRLNEIKDSIKKLESKEAQKKSEERWKPKNQESYFYIDSTHETIQEANDEDEVFNLHYKALNVFKTRAEAEKERDIRQIWFELRKFAKEWNAKFGTSAYFVRHGISFKNSTLIDQELKDKFGDRLKLLDDL
jgi:hypothetical protein